MYYCSNYVTAVLLCVVTMFCWGSWGNSSAADRGASSRT